MKEELKIGGLLLGGMLLFATNQPLQAQSVNPFSFTSVSVTEEGAIRLAWQSESNTLYTIEYADDLIDPDLGITVWKTLYDNYPSHDANGTNTFWLDTGNYFLESPVPHPKYTTNRFYRIVSQGTNSGLIPYIAITTPTNNAVLSGLVTVSVVATSDYPVVTPFLFVDGQEMYRSDDDTNFVINTCEWPNGPHVLFATVKAASAFSGPLEFYPIDVGRAASPYVNVTFSNLIAKASISEPFFEPALGQTQVVSAAFAANVNWTLQVLDEGSNTVQFGSGSGTKMSFNWDGNGTNGVSLPDGIYNYLISAQTNGLASGAEMGGGSESASQSTASESATDAYWPRTIRDAVAAGLDYYYVQFPPLPPYRSNGVWIAREWEPPKQVQIPQATIESYQQQFSFQTSPSSGDSGSGDGPTPLAYGGPSNQSTTIPTRAQNAGVKGTNGTFGAAFFTYKDTNVVACPKNQPPIPQTIPINGSTASRPCPPLVEADSAAIDFVQTMGKRGWKLKYFKRSDDLHVNDMRRDDLGINGGNLFTRANIGLFISHGALGGAPDSTPGGGGANQTYFPSAHSNDTPDAWLRMGQVGMGGDLLWLCMLNCDAFSDPNYNSMINHGAIPLKTTHLVCGAASLNAITEHMCEYWAINMLDKTNKIPDAWFNAGLKEFTKSYNRAPFSNSVIFRVVGYTECFDDTVKLYTTNYTINPNNITKRDRTVLTYP